MFKYRSAAFCVGWGILRATFQHIESDGGVEIGWMRCASDSEWEVVVAFVVVVVIVLLINHCWKIKY